MLNFYSYLLHTHQQEVVASVSNTNFII